MSSHLLLGASSKMKVFLILWALGLSACNKLDYTYLPPPGAETSGGYHEILDFLLEFPKEKYPSSLDSGVDRIVEVSSTKPYYSNLAVGINRQGLQPTSSESNTAGTGIPFSETIYNVPSTTPLYALTQTTTVAPVQNYETEVGLMDSNFNGPKISTQYNFEVDGAQGLNKDFHSNIPVYTSQDTNNAPFLHYSNGSYNGFPGYKMSNNRRPVSSSLSPQDFTNSDYQSGQNSDQFDKSPEVNARPPYSDYYDENDSATYNIQQSPEIYMEILKYSTSKPVENFHAEDTDIYGPTKTPDFAKLAPNQLPASSTVSTPIEFKSREYSSTPTTSLRDKFGAFYSTVNRPERVRDKTDRNATILNYENLLTSDGFAYSYDTSNGIHADESGTAVNGVRAQGSYSYIGDDGKVYSITYTADENGFIPRGDHLPTAPPIPNAILKVIEQAAKNKQSGVTDDGSYDDTKYGHGRYQGFMGRKPQDPKFTLGKRPTNSLLLGELTPYKNYTPIIDGHNYLYDAYTGNKVTISTERPYANVGNINKKNYYTNDETKQFVPSNKYDDNNSIHRTRGMLVNKQLIDGPINKSTGGIKTIYRTSVPQRTHYGANNQNKGIKLPPIIEEYTENQQTHDGYEYNTPQSIFQPYEISTLQQFLQNSNRESTEFPSNSFNDDTDLQGNKQVIAQNLNYPESGMIDLSKSYSKNSYKDSEFPKNSYNDGNDNIFSTPRPVYGSTSPETYYYESKIKNNDEQEQKYPSSAARPQYSSTTPLTPEFTSPSSSTINIADYSVTTPASNKFISTLRPSVDSPTSGSILRKPGYSVVSTSGQGPIAAIGTSTAIPSNINRTHGRFGNRNKPALTVTNNYSKDIVQRLPQTNNEKKLKLDVSDLISENIGSQSTTERVIGEDFNGPKQTQRYDPEHGYYY